VIEKPPGFFEGTEMPTAGWWEALWPDPASVLRSVGITPGMDVIDLCSGDGWFTMQIAKIARHVVAIDIDAELLDVARKRLAESGIKNCDLVAGDAYEVARLSPEPADFVFMANAFHGVPDKPRLARAVRNALKPGGRFAIVNWHQQPREDTMILGEPRGPRTDLRLSPEQTINAARVDGMKHAGLFDVPPYHYALILERVGTMATILNNKDPKASSVFQPAALLREARRQKGVPAVDVPPVCILDPDGDIVRRLRKEGRARVFDGWPCYHTELDTFELAGRTVGIIGCAVGAPFAVLIAEELFASSCSLLLSLTSAGQIVPAGPTPYFVIIDRALRDEGTSYHYAPAAEYGEADPALVKLAAKAIKAQGGNPIVGMSWTTDAPFRETAQAIEAAKARGILAVEMEAAALYTFAKAQGARVLCLAHVTNTMAQSGLDFEKGEADGTIDALRLLEVIVSAT
jgi:uridine phosphorylase/protein-L-isoaspartate O-methyltransferase